MVTCILYQKYYNT